jgi:hypothetical protein
MPQVGFEPTIPVFQWAKTVHVLDPADDTGLKGQNILEAKEVGGENLGGLIWLRKGPSGGLLRTVLESNIIIIE